GALEGSIAFCDLKPVPALKISFRNRIKSNEQIKRNTVASQALGHLIAAIAAPAMADYSDLVPRVTFPPQRNIFGNLTIGIVRKIGFRLMRVSFAAINSELSVKRPILCIQGSANKYDKRLFAVGPNVTP
ncbi:hypothetical protein VZ95_09410, partial [Elstera litoralis]